MTTCKFWVTVLVGILLLANAAAGADAAKEAYQKGVACLEKKELNAAIAAFTEAIRLNPKDAVAYCGRAGAYFQQGECENFKKADVATSNRSMKKPSSISRRPSASTRRMPRRIAIGGFPTTGRATLTKPLPTSPRPFI